MLTGNGVRNKQELSISGLQLFDKSGSIIKNSVFKKNERIFKINNFKLK